MAGTWNSIDRRAIAERWASTLSASKKKNLTLLLSHPDILQAMDKLLIFPGHWKGLEFGNWAKHLAAHINPAIVNYWNHIYNTWRRILAGHEELCHLVDEGTVASLQYLAPGWSTKDLHTLQCGFDEKQLFPQITNPSTRNQILENIKGLDTVIPSIKTFHENMAFITIGAKILEREVETAPPRGRRKKVEINHHWRSLYNNLMSDWMDEGWKIEKAPGIMATGVGVSNPLLSFVQAILAALRYFYFLSDHAPLRDNRDKKLPNLNSDLLSQYQKLFYQIIGTLGFYNEKVKDGYKGPISTEDSILPMYTGHWRGGKPSFKAMRILELTAFLPSMALPHGERKLYVEPLYILGDMLEAFFLWKAVFITRNAEISISVDAIDNEVKTATWKPPSRDIRKIGGSGVERIIKQNKQPNEFKAKAENRIQKQSNKNGKHQQKQTRPQQQKNKHMQKEGLLIDGLAPQLSALPSAKQPFTPLATAPQPSIPNNAISSNAFPDSPPVAIQPATQATTSNPDRSSIVSALLIGHDILIPNQSREAQREEQALDMDTSEDTSIPPQATDSTVAQLHPIHPVQTIGTEETTTKPINNQVTVQKSVSSKRQGIGAKWTAARAKGQATKRRNMIFRPTTIASNSNNTKPQMDEVNRLIGPSPGIIRVNEGDDYDTIPVDLDVNCSSTIQESNATKTRARGINERSRIDKGKGLPRKKDFTFRATNRRQEGKIRGDDGIGYKKAPKEPSNEDNKREKYRGNASSTHRQNNRMPSQNKLNLSSDGDYEDKDQLSSTNQSNDQAKDIPMATNPNQEVHIASRRSSVISTLSSLSNVVKDTERPSYSEYEERNSTTPTTQLGILNHRDMAVASHSNSMSTRLQNIVHNLRLPSPEIEPEENNLPATGDGNNEFSTPAGEDDDDDYVNMEVPVSEDENDPGQIQEMRDELTNLSPKVVSPFILHKEQEGISNPMATEFENHREMDIEGSDNDMSDSDLQIIRPKIGASLAQTHGARDQVVTREEHLLQPDTIINEADNSDKVMNDSVGFDELIGSLNSLVPNLKEKGYQNPYIIFNRDRSRQAVTTIDNSGNTNGQTGATEETNIVENNPPEILYYEINRPTQSARQQETRRQSDTTHTNDSTNRTSQRQSIKTTNRKDPIPAPTIETPNPTAEGIVCPASDYEEIIPVQPTRNELRGLSPTKTQEPSPNEGHQKDHGSTFSNYRDETYSNDLDNDTERGFIPTKSAFDKIIQDSNNKSNDIAFGASVIDTTATGQDTNDAKNTLPSNYKEAKENKPRKGKTNGTPYKDKSSTDVMAIDGQDDETYESSTQLVTTAQVLSQDLDMISKIHRNDLAADSEPPIAKEAVGIAPDYMEVETGFPPQQGEKRALVLQDTGHRAKRKKVIKSFGPKNLPSSSKKPPNSLEKLPNSSKNMAKKGIRSRWKEQKEIQKKIQNQIQKGQAQRQQFITQNTTFTVKAPGQQSNGVPTSPLPSFAPRAITPPTPKLVRRQNDIAKQPRRNNQGSVVRVPLKINTDIVLEDGNATFTQNEMSTRSGNTSLFTPTPTNNTQTKSNTPTVPARPSTPLTPLDIM